MKTLAFLFALILPATARLGENAEQCAARYGTPTLEPEDGLTKWYSKNGIKIHVTFRSSVAVSISFSHDPSGLTDVLTKLTDEKIQALLDANAVGGPWIKREWPRGKELNVINGKTLLRGDLKAQSEWDYLSGHLVIITTDEMTTRSKEKKALLDKQNEAKKQEAIRSTEGF